MTNSFLSTIYAPAGERVPEWKEFSEENNLSYFASFPAGLLNEWDNRAVSVACKEDIRRTHWIKKGTFQVVEMFLFVFYEAAHEQEPMKAAPVIRD